MKSNKFSETAEGAAAVRTAHRLFDQPIIFDDPYAVHFLTPHLKRIHTNFLLHRLIMRIAMRAVKPIEGQVLCRAAYAEECLESAIKQGVEQYVIIGAGFDSFGLRRQDLMKKVTLYELDHPNTQRAKLNVLNDLIASIPAHWHFAPIDFESQTLEEVLNALKIDKSRPVFFSWLGTTPYLTEEATRSTLETLSHFASEGSELVFDYLIPSDMLTAVEQKNIRLLMKLAENRGEPLIGFYPPETMARTLASIGLSVTENMSPEEQNLRYFAERKDGFVTTPNSWFAHCRMNG